MFSSDLGKRYRKALVVGAGGGGDIVSDALAAMYLQRQGIETDVAGLLSPAAMHVFPHGYEDIVNELSEDVIRFIPSKKPVNISFVDAALPGAARELGIPVDNFYDLSVRYGPSSLVLGLECLIEKNGYDLVVAVDMGGDILARGREDSTLLSPMLDFSSLYALGQLSVDTLLVEFGLGTDGELRPDGMHDILQELNDNNLLLYEGHIFNDDHEVRKFRELVKSLAHIREGHATKKTLETLDTDTPDEDIVSNYKPRYRIGNLKRRDEFPITLPHQFFGKTYVIKAKEFAKSRPKTAFDYSNPLEQYVKLKTMAPEWKTELDLHHLWSDETWRTTSMSGYCMLLLVPPTSLEKSMRKEIIREGMEYMKRDMCDLVLVRKGDLEPIPSKFQLMSAGDFFLVSYDNVTSSFLKETGNLIAKYQK
jgi:hypothetical protein